MMTEEKITEIFCLADNFVKYLKNLGLKRNLNVLVVLFFLDSMYRNGWIRGLITCRIAMR